MGVPCVQVLVVELVGGRDERIVAEGTREHCENIYFIILKSMNTCYAYKYRHKNRFTETVSRYATSQNVHFFRLKMAWIVAIHHPWFSTISRVNIP